jgi:hypothetical protein
VIVNYSTPERWAAILAESSKRKAEEDAQSAEFEVQRSKAKEEERARFASAHPGASAVPVSPWAGRRLKVIVKVALVWFFNSSSMLIRTTGCELHSPAGPGVHRLMAY